MSTQKLFEMLLNELGFDLTEYLDTENLSVYQTQVLEKATEILKDNTVGEVQKIGGNFKKNEDKFKQFTEQAEKKLDEEKYKGSKKELKKKLQDYTKKLRDVIAKTCFAVIPVKEMPWVDVIFRNAPRVMFEEDKVKVAENLIAYYGEIKCVISRTTVYAKMKGADPLFAPIRGELDLKGYEIDDSEQIAEKAKIFPYISAVLESLDANTTRSQVAKYHEGYQRHGEPICDFLMKDEDLMESMKKLTTGTDSGRTSSDIAVSAIAIPHQSDNKTLLITVDESKDDEKYGNCFEALLKFSAACCEAPSTKTAGAAQASPVGPAGETPGMSAGPSAGGPQGGVRTPGGQNLSVWSAEELAEEAQKRGGGGVPPDMEVWNEEDLTKMAQERGSGIPEGMEVWSEEDLEELKKERQGGGLNIPEWEPDKDMEECANCGYGLRKGWSECPVCGTAVGSAAPPQSTPDTETSPPEPEIEAESSQEPEQEVPETKEQASQEQEENDTTEPDQ